ncbi:hypothetical protein QTP88_017937 [Uroleucon formosanum]
MKPLQQKLYVRGYPNLIKYSTTIDYFPRLQYLSELLDINKISKNFYLHFIRNMDGNKVFLEYLLILDHLSTLEWTKYAENQSLPIHQDITHNGCIRLKSRKPAHISMRKLIADRYDGLADWKSEWEKSNQDTHNIIQSLENPLPGHQLPRREWVVLNRLRTGHRRCKELLHKWKMADLPDCDCGHPS